MNDDKHALMTIGQLARQVRVRTSTLRFYEQEGLLTPDARSESGYRLYRSEAVQRLRLIQRSQRLGFSLADIKSLLDGWESGELSDAAVISTAEQRYLALEKQITQLMVLQHEVALFVQDMHGRNDQPFRDDDSALDRLLGRVCGDSAGQSSSTALFEWLLVQTGCNLTTESGRLILERLRSLHVHIWQEGEAYHILVVSEDPAVARAMQSLTQLEADCQAHAALQSEFVYGDEGYLLVVSGENAFIFARLFLALEEESAHNQARSHGQLTGPYE